jgi:hypothetical protein
MPQRVREEWNGPDEARMVYSFNNASGFYLAKLMPKINMMRINELRV